MASSAPRSSAPISPRVRLDSSRWTVTTSDGGEQLLPLDPADADLGGALVGEVLAPGDDVHAEGQPDAGDLAALPAEADDAEAWRRPGRCRRSPASRRRARRRPPGDVPGGGEDQPPGQLRGCRSAAMPGAADGDAAFRRRPRRRWTCCACPVVTSSRRFGSRSRTDRAEGGALAHRDDDVEGFAGGRRGRPRRRGGRGTRPPRRARGPRTSRSRWRPRTGSRRGRRCDARARSTTGSASPSWSVARVRRAGRHDLAEGPPPAAGALLLAVGERARRVGDDEVLGRRDERRAEAAEQLLLGLRGVVELGDELRVGPCGCRRRRRSSWAPAGPRRAIRAGRRRCRGSRRRAP